MHKIFFNEPLSLRDEELLHSIPALIGDELPGRQHNIVIDTTAPINGTHFYLTGGQSPSVLTVFSELRN